MTFPSFLAATSFSSNGSGDVVLGILVLLVALAVIVLDYIAIFKIITKAGYSGWWIFIPLSPPIAYGISYGAIFDRVSAYNDYGDSATFWRQIVGWLIFVGITLLIQWVFFYVFAFSDWPVRRQLRRATLGSQPVPYPVAFAQDVQDLGIARAEPMPVPHDPAPEGPGLRCSRCGATVTGGTRFCESCGQPTFSMPAVPSDPPSVAAASIPNADRTPEAAAPRFWEDHPGAVTVPPNEHDTADADPSPKEVGGPEPVEAAPHCRMCTHPIEVGSRFCGRCGAAIAAT